MGLFDSIERLITEHGSAAILREQIALLKEQFAILEKKLANCEAKIQNLEVDKENLRLEINKLNGIIENFKQENAKLKKTITDMRQGAPTQAPPWSPFDNS